MNQEIANQLSQFYEKNNLTAFILGRESEPINEEYFWVFFKKHNAARGPVHKSQKGPKKHPQVLNPIIEFILVADFLRFFILQKESLSLSALNNQVNHLKN